MENGVALFMRDNFPECLLLFALVLIAIVLIKIHGHLKDLKEHFFMDRVARHHDKKNKTAAGKDLEICP